MSKTKKIKERKPIPVDFNSFTCPPEVIHSRAADQIRYTYSEGEIKPDSRLTAFLADYPDGLGCDWETSIVQQACDAPMETLRRWVEDGMPHGFLRAELRGVLYRRLREEAALIAANGEPINPFDSFIADPAEYNINCMIHTAKTLFERARQPLWTLRVSVLNPDGKENLNTAKTIESVLEYITLHPEVLTPEKLEQAITLMVSGYERARLIDLQEKLYGGTPKA